MGRISRGQKTRIKPTHSMAVFKVLPHFASLVFKGKEALTIAGREGRRREQQRSVTCGITSELEEMNAKPREDANVAEALAAKCQGPAEKHAEVRMLSQEAVRRELECSSSQVHVIDLTNDTDTDRGGHHLVHLIEGTYFSMTATMPQSKACTPAQARRTIY